MRNASTRAIRLAFLLGFAACGSSGSAPDEAVTDDIVEADGVKDVLDTWTPDPALDPAPLPDPGIDEAAGPVDTPWPPDESGGDVPADVPADVPSDPAVDPAVDPAIDPATDDPADEDPGASVPDPGPETASDLPADACAPDCGGRECGDDGCGGECGTCANGKACTAGVCAWSLELGIVSGDGQVGEPDRLVAPLVVRALAGDGTPVSGVQIAFSPAPGAWVDPPVAATDLAGEARVSFRLGLAPGPCEVVATAEGTAPVAFSATVRAPERGILFTAVNADGAGGTFEGPGPGAAAHTGAVTAVVAAPDGTFYLADGDASCSVYRLSREGVLVRIAGSGACGFGGDGGAATAALLDGPEGLALDGTTGTLFVADAGNGRVRAIDLDEGTIATVAGGGDPSAPDAGDGGPAADAFLGRPTALLLGPDRGLYVASSEAPHGIRRIDPETGVITTVVPCAADPSTPLSPVAIGGGLAWDRDGLMVFSGSFVGTAVNPSDPSTAVFAIARVDLDGTLRHVAGVQGGGSGDGIPATQAFLPGAARLASDRGGDLYLALAAEHRVRRIDAATGLVATVAGTGTAGFAGDYGPAVDALLDGPDGIALDPDGSLVIADRGNNALRVAWQVADRVAPARAADLLVTFLSVYAVTPSGTLVRRELARTDDPATPGDERVRWAVAGGFDPVTPMQAMDKRIVICRQGTLEVRSEADGALEGSVPEACGGGFASGEDGVVYSARGPDVRAVALPSTVLWTAAPAGGDLSAPVVLDDGTIVVAAAGDGAYGLDPASGATRWRHPCAATGGLAVGSDGRILVAARDGLHFVDPAMCTPCACPAVAVASLAGYGTPGDVVLVGEREHVYLPLQGGGVVAVVDGLPLWHQPDVSGTVFLLGSRERMYLGTRDGSVVSLSTWWGAPIAVLEIASGWPVNGLWLTEHGELWIQAGPFVANRWTNLLVGLSTGAWPRLRRDGRNQAAEGLRDGCVTNCEGQACLWDECGGYCGFCGSGDECLLDGKCSRRTTDCGAVPAEGCCHGRVVLSCNAGVLDTFMCPPELPCGWFAYGATGRYTCGGSGADPSGTFPLACDLTCVPDCAGRECGGDGCGGSCGGCGEGKQCIATRCMAGCGGVPAIGCCRGGNLLECKEDEGLVEMVCGYSGCGWSEPHQKVACGESWTPPAGIAVECPDGCVPACDGRQCGGDGCGGACGTCDEGSACEDGACVALPGCGDASCDADAREDCATCPADCGCGCGESCMRGRCAPTACEGKACGDDGCGGTCGACPDGQVCGDDGRCAVTDCTDRPDFEPCRLVTSPDLDYDICLDGVCASPGTCGSGACNIGSPGWILPDTGQRACYTSAVVTAQCAAEPHDTVPCDGAATPAGQDATAGWDANHAASERWARTHGEEPRVTDRITGLEWQGCQAGRRGPTCELSGAALVCDDAFFCQRKALAYCDALEWGGADDWRLPGRHELESIVDYGRCGPAIDPTAFPDTEPGLFLTSSMSGTDFMTNPFAIDFETGVATYWPGGGDDRPTSARCVRGGGPRCGTRFVATSGVEEPVVEDRVTRLMWQGCRAGFKGATCSKVASATECTYFTIGCTWEGALAFCQDMVWAGHDDWRLPSVREMASLVDDGKTVGSAFPDDLFPQSDRVFWTSTSSADDPLWVWIVSGFAEGRTSVAGKLNKDLAFRCVRDLP